MQEQQPTLVRQQGQPKRRGLVVRTGLRAGLAWDELDDKAKELWNSLTNSVTNAAQTVQNSVTPTQS